MGMGWGWGTSLRKCVTCLTRGTCRPRLPHRRITPAGRRQLKHRIQTLTTRVAPLGPQIRLGCVVRIQAHWRGWRGRKHVRAIRNLNRLKMMAKMSFARGGPKEVARCLIEQMSRGDTLSNAVLDTSTVKLSYGGWKHLRAGVGTINHLRAAVRPAASPASPRTPRRARRPCP